MFINMALLWMSWFELCANDIWRIEPNNFIKYLGILLFGLGIIMFFIALLTIKTLENFEGDLITKGIYSVTRHPMYVGFILWLIGLPLFFGAVFSLMLSFIFILNILFWRHLEEIELAKRFTSYAEYKKKTLF
jgi:protein-S-isoprenylcysteine O-methyltransferase Ste14